LYYVYFWVCHRFPGGRKKLADVQRALNTLVRFCDLHVMWMIPGRILRIGSVGCCGVAGNSRSTSEQAKPAWCAVVQAYCAAIVVVSFMIVLFPSLFDGNWPVPRFLSTGVVLAAVGIAFVVGLERHLRPTLPGRRFWREFASRRRALAAVAIITLCVHQFNISRIALDRLYDALKGCSGSGCFGAILAGPHLLVEYLSFVLGVSSLAVLLGMGLSRLMQSRG
jgi:hypothetical protein